MISLDECNGSCNVLSLEIWVQKVTKKINIKVFNMVTNNNESKVTAKYISCECKWKFNSTSSSSNQKWNNKTFSC